MNVRLIDKDALEEAVKGSINIMESHGISMIAASVPLVIIKGALTIDAIPVEWLRGYTAVGVAPTGDRLTEGKERLIVHRILNEWQKEQEASE
jgi:hypothetical protein